MPDPAEQLQQLYLAGFEFETFERYPNAIGAIRGSFLALLQAAPQGLAMIGLPGRRMGEVLGVVIEKDGKKFFQAKNELVIASDQDLADLQQFRAEIENVLKAGTAQ